MMKFQYTGCENMINNNLALLGGETTITSQLNYNWPIITQEDKDYVMETLNKGEVSYNYKDDEIHRLEVNFQNYLDIPYCLALNSGTSALYLAFLSLGLKAGDEVIVPTYTFPATIMPLLHLGVKPIFVDTAKDSPNTSADMIEKKLSDRTKAIVIAHMDGLPVEGHEIQRLAEMHNCYLIEDCAQALGAKISDKLVGTFGTISIFSLQQKKLVVGGEGGILATRDREIYEKCILLSYLQKRSNNEVESPALSPYAYTGLGFNFRIHPLAAALANIQFNKIEENLQQRRKVLTQIAELLKDIKEIKVPQVNNGESAYYSFKMLYCSEQAENLPIEIYIKALNAEGLTLDKSITRPLHLEPIFNPISSEFLMKNYSNDSFIISDDSSFKNGEDYYNRALRMPPFYDLSDSEIKDIVQAFKKVSNNINALKEYYQGITS